MPSKITELTSKRRYTVPVASNALSYDVNGLRRSLAQIDRDRESLVRWDALGGVPIRIGEGAFTLHEDAVNTFIPGRLLRIGGTDIYRVKTAIISDGVTTVTVDTNLGALPVVMGDIEVETIHPELLPIKAASTDALGIVQLATPKETLDGIDETKVVTPLGVKTAIEAIPAVEIPSIPPIPPGVPTGAMFWFPVPTPPDGYLICNGAALSKSVYGALFGVIGYSYGGSGETFNLPDLMDEFVRGGGENVGVKQLDAAAVGGLLIFVYAPGGETIGNNGLQVIGSYVPSGPPYGIISGVQITSQKPVYTTSGRTASETRPRNITLLPCVKY